MELSLSLVFNVLFEFQEEKAEPVQPTKPPINLLVEEEPAAKRLNLCGFRTTELKGGESSSQFRWFTIAKIEL